MAELEYLLLAEFARVDRGGLLTIVGGNFDSLAVDTLPQRHMIAVAGRVRMADGDDHLGLKITISGPEGSFELVTDHDLPLPTQGAPELGPPSAVFAAQAVIPLLDYGVYAVSAQVGEGTPRVVRFRVTPPTPTGGAR